MFRAIQSVILFAIAILSLASASAQCVPSLCSITIILSSDSSGVTLGGTGTNAATMAFTTMQAFGGTVPSGVTRTVGATSWTITTPFDIKVVCTVILTLLPCGTGVSPNFTLTAKLQSADSTNTWTVHAQAINSSSTTTLTAAGPYFTAVSYQFALTIPFSESAGAISNTVNFVATAN